MAKKGAQTNPEEHCFQMAISGMLAVTSSKDETGLDKLHDHSNYVLIW